MIPGRSRANCRNKWLSTQNVKTCKSPWNEEDDISLKALVKKFGTKSWKIIAVEFNKEYFDRNRTGKQCRDRWLNYLRPELRKYFRSILDLK